MEITGLCTSCGKSDKMHTCSICGGQFCFNCIDIQRGICKPCRSGLKFEEEKSTNF